MGVCFMKVNEIKQFLAFQAKALDCLEFLIKYDREQAEKNNQPAERTVVLKAFVDTQRRSLDIATLLLKKHEPALKQDEETKANAEKEKRAKELKQKANEHNNITSNITPKATENTEVGLFDILQEENK